MAEYTYEDIIMDPEDPRLEGAIGKKCYFSDYPKKLLSSAIYNSLEYLDCLTDIRKEGDFPFVDENEVSWTVVIIKKEEPKPQYVPFESKEEFLDEYYNSETGRVKDGLEHYLSTRGLWLKDTDRDVYCLVTEIWNYGVVVGDSKMNTTKDGNKYFTINGVTTWEELLMGYTFIDDSPCGKLAEEEQ